MWRNNSKWIKFQLNEKTNIKWAQGKHQEKNNKDKISNLRG